MGSLHLAVHDVTPAHEKDLRTLTGLIEEAGIQRYSLLVVPDYHGRWNLLDHPEFCRWLSHLRNSGAEILLHGFTHLGRRDASGPGDRIRSALFTRGEGEFMCLDVNEASELLANGRDLLREALGVSVRGFVAPSWLYGRGTLDALSETGFRLAESRWRVWDPVEGVTLLRVPVANYAGGGWLKRLSAAGWVSLYGTLLSGSPVLRFALHPTDVQGECGTRRILRRLDRLSEGRDPVHLGDLLSAS